jgi:hypothetical protein
MVEPIAQVVLNDSAGVRSVRRLLSAGTVAAGVLTTLAVPVLARPVATAHAVAPYVLELPGAAARQHTHFDLVGATWRPGHLDPGSSVVQVRVHRAGHWSDWTDLTPEDGGADGGSPDATRAAALQHATVVTDPVWVGRSDGVQTRTLGPAPHDLHVVLIDGGTSAADADPEPAKTFGATADAAASEPTIYTRADWGADESLRKKACPDGPDYAPTIKMGFIHHTDNSNGYSKSDVPSIIRSIYAYHVKSNGWCDVGYNFLVDRFGRIWQGRYGGITKPVIGAHTGGFNVDSFGTGMIGTFNSTKPSAALLRAVERLFAWQFGRYYLDPKGTATMTAADFSGSKFAEGSTVTFHAVSGHRDADYTDCPGTAAYDELARIRAAIAADMGAGFVAPSLSSQSARMATGSATVTAGVIGHLAWKLTITDGNGAVVDTIKGTATRSHPVAATWPLVDANGLPVPPATYTVRLTGTTSSSSARAWSAPVTVTPPLTITVPAHAAYQSTVTPHGKGVPGHKVAASSTVGGVTQPLGTFPVSSKGSWAATAPVDLTGDISWAATDTSISSYTAQAATRVAPVISTPSSSPAFVRAGAALHLGGTALPGTTVAVQSRPTDGTSWSTVAGQAAGSDGSWSADVTPGTSMTVRAVDSRGLRSASLIVFPVAAPNATAPTDGYAGRRVLVTGNAGDAPVQVHLDQRSPGASWSVVRTVTASPDGVFAARLPLPDAAGSSVQWRVRTGFGSAVTGAVALTAAPAPTIAGPRQAGWDTAHLLHGTAVPGDKVTVWTAPPGSTSWTARSTVRATSAGTWSTTLRFRSDRDWRATSPSGTSGTGTTSLVPTVTGPAKVAAGSAAVVHGLAEPGATVLLQHSVDNGTTWTQVSATTADDQGRWSRTRHPRATVQFRVEVAGRSSRVISVAVG